MHRFYLKASLIEKEFVDNADLITKFKKDTGVKFLLKRKEIKDIKSSYSNKYNKMTLYELIQAIKEEDLLF